MADIFITFLQPLSPVYNLWSIHVLLLLCMGSTIDVLYLCLPVNTSCPDLSITGQLIALSTPVCGLSALWMSSLVRYCLLKDTYLQKAKHLRYGTTMYVATTCDDLRWENDKQTMGLFTPCLFWFSVSSFNLNLKLNFLPYLKIQNTIIRHQLFYLVKKSGNSLRVKFYSTFFIFFFIFFYLYKELFFSWRLNLKKKKDHDPPPPL